MTVLLLSIVLLTTLPGTIGHGLFSQTSMGPDPSSLSTVRARWPAGHALWTAYTREGRLRGRWDLSAGGQWFFSFRGIPYGRPPGRFSPPQRYPRWRGVRDASQHGSQCLQWDDQVLQGAEDCLFANVYTRLLPGPSTPVVQRLPVMVFVHGGGFVTGSGDGVKLGPHYFMDEDIVLVTFNYRLGPLGFFTTHDAAAPGNYGLLDQVLLLEWVRDNIAGFGGDPRAVTIFGTSAGGASVSLLVLSPLARGLFHHAISQSGSAIANFSASGRRKALADRFAAELGCSSDTSAALVACARTASAHDLMHASKSIRLTELHTDGRFLPRVDNETAQPFLPEDPRVLLQSGRFSMVPWMSGLNEEEGVLFSSLLLGNENLLAGLYAGNLPLWSQVTDLTTRSETSIVDCGVDPLKETQNVYQFITGKLGATGPTNLLPLIRLITDRVFVTSSSEEMRLASAFTPVYRYMLDHRGPGRLFYHSPVPGLPDFGVTHSDELAYMFNREGQSDLQRPGSPAYTMIRFMVNLWTSFARTGRPSSDVLSMPEWPIFTEKSQRHMRLNSEPELGERMFEERINFWQTVRINEPWRHPLEECDPTLVKEFTPVSIGNATLVFSF